MSRAPDFQDRREPFRRWAVLNEMKPPVKGLVFAFLAVLSTWAAEAQSKVETADAARIYLTWNAPYGLPRAASNLTLAAGDTTREDTLYLTCEPATNSPMLRALTANLEVHPAAGDTIGPYWRFGRAGKDIHNVRLRITRDSTVTLTVPWVEGKGVGAVGYDYSSVQGRMAALVAVPTARADSIRSGKRYVLARLLFRRPLAGIAGTGRPMCIEWTRAKLALTEGLDLQIERGERFASWNSPGCEVCRPFRGPLAPKTWSPKSGR